MYTDACALSSETQKRGRNQIQSTVPFVDGLLRNRIFEDFSYWFNLL